MHGISPIIAVHRSAAIGDDLGQLAAGIGRIKRVGVIGVPEICDIAQRERPRVADIDVLIMQRTEVRLCCHQSGVIKLARRHPRNATVDAVSVANVVMYGIILDIRSDGVQLRILDGKAYGYLDIRLAEYPDKVLVHGLNIIRIILIERVGVIAGREE